MNRVEYDTTKKAMRDRLISSIKNHNSSELEIANAIYDVWEGLVDEQVKLFFEDVEKKLLTKVDGIKIKIAENLRKTYSGIQITKEEWPKAVGVGTSFESSNYGNMLIGIFGLIENNKDKGAVCISKNIHTDLYNAASTLDFNCCDVPKFSDYWPAYSYIRDMQNLTSHNTILLMSGSLQYAGQSYLDLIVNDLVSLINIVDQTVLEHSDASA